jgi:hypothetical protein
LFEKGQAIAIFSIYLSPRTPFLIPGLDPDMGKTASYFLPFLPVMRMDLPYPENQGHEIALLESDLSIPT